MSDKICKGRPRVSQKKTFHYSVYDLLRYIVSDIKLGKKVSVSEVNKRYGVYSPFTVHCLKLLVDIGICEKRKIGREYNYIEKMGG